MDRERECPPKSEWGDGPWQQEEDSRIWVHGDIPCFIYRHSEFGNLNGYIGVPSTHPWYACEFTDLEMGVEVHGGLTYAGPLDGLDELKQYAHMKFWWIGFDTAHAWDFTPGIYALLRSLDPLTSPPPSGGVYRDMAYVKAEVERMAKQAIRAWHSATDLQRLQELEEDL